MDKVQRSKLLDAVSNNLRVNGLAPLVLLLQDLCDADAGGTLDESKVARIIVKIDDLSASNADSYKRIESITAEFDSKLKSTLTALSQRIFELETLAQKASDDATTAMETAHSHDPA